MLPKIAIICFFISVNIGVFILDGWLVKKNHKNILVTSDISFSLVIAVCSFSIALIKKKKKLGRRDIRIYFQDGISDHTHLWGRVDLLFWAVLWNL